MTHWKKNRARLSAAIAGTGLVLAMWTAGAVAQDSDSKTKADDPAEVLRGPAVEDRDVPGQDSTFGDSEMKPGRDKERPVAHGAFMGALRSLGGEDVSADLRATEEQIDAVRAIDKEYRDDRRAYMKEHGEEMRDLMGQIRPEGARGERGQRSRRGEPGERGERGRRGEPGERGRPGDRGRSGERGAGPPEGRPKINPDDLNEEQRAAFERLKEIRADGPQASAYHVRMWEVLTVEQQGYVRGRLDEIRERGVEEGKGGLQREDVRGRKRTRDRDDLRDGGRGGGRALPPEEDGGRPGERAEGRFGRGRGGGPPEASGEMAFGGRGFGGQGSGGPEGRGGGGFGRGFDGGPDAPRWERIHERIDRMSPEVRGRVLMQIERLVDRMESRFVPPAPPPMDDVMIPE